MPPKRNKKAASLYIRIEADVKAKLDKHVAEEKPRRAASDGKGYVYGKLYNQSIAGEEAIRKLVE
jgi:hypothetical protein